MIRSLTSQQAEELLQYLMNDSAQIGGFRSKHRNYTMALLMLDAGLRVGELVKLTMFDLWHISEPVKSLEIRAEIAKTKRPRSIPMSMRLRVAIATMKGDIWKGWYGTPEYFAFYAGRPEKGLSIRQAQRIIYSAGLKALHLTVCPHMLRHTFATRIMKKCSIRVVQELLGHSSLTSTQIYTHPNNLDCEKAIASLSE